MSSMSSTSTRRLIYPAVVLAVAAAVGGTAAWSGGRSSVPFLVMATLALGWIVWLAFRAAHALVKDAPVVEAGVVATGKRRKELEREKAALLKALKELDFDHQMGKVSDKDFADISAIYRGRAIRVMRQLDDAGRDYEVDDRRATSGSGWRRRPLSRATTATAAVARKPRADEQVRQVQHAQRQRRGVLQEVRARSSCGRRREAARRLVTLLVIFSSLALAQPMMIDPSKMSGIPRPDPQVPAGTITVRLIRGELSNRMTGIEVGLVGADGKVRTAEDRRRGARDLLRADGAGAVQAKATDGVEELASQPIELQRDIGSRVMLVFQPKGGAADGIARPDKAIPAGTIIVRAAGEGGEAIAGVDVVLGHARRRRAQDARSSRARPTPRATRPSVASTPSRTRATSPRSCARASTSVEAVRAQGEHGLARHHRRAAGVEATSRRCASGPARTSSSRSRTTSCRSPRCGG